jgi:hypothetical protein
MGVKTNRRPLIASLFSDLHSCQLGHKFRKKLVQWIAFHCRKFSALCKDIGGLKASAKATAGKTLPEPAMGPEKITSWYITAARLPEPRLQQPSP